MLEEEDCQVVNTDSTGSSTLYKEYTLNVKIIIILRSPFRSFSAALVNGRINKNDFYGNYH